MSGAAGEVVADHFACQVEYAAPPRAVFEAASRPGGPNGWWTTSGGVAREAGERLRLDWSDGDGVVFRIDELTAPSEMTWTCIEQRDRNLPRPDEWVGTALRFRFAAVRGGTRLDFEHLGLSARLECFEICEGGWDFFLRRSLRQLVELGRGLPYQAKNLR